MIKKLLKFLDFSPNPEEIRSLKESTNELLEELREVSKKQKLAVEFFVGGSFAKGTLMKKDVSDIDIFVRFDWRYEQLTDKLEKLILSLNKKYRVEKIHGSRDYFKISLQKSVVFELIPVLAIKHSKEARNVMDLSYFHVRYVKKHLTPALAKEVLLAKAFCKACGVYGAESYIRGFSGYGLECLIIHYKSFEKMLKALVKVKERLLLDPEHHYHTQEEILYTLNEARLQSPIVLVDPTWKERNVLAALHSETFKKFQLVARNFLKKPSKRFFEEKRFDLDSLQRKAKAVDAEVVHLQLTTQKQKGDIAGTTLKKFTRFLERILSRYFQVVNQEFLYDEEQKADVFFLLRSKKEIIIMGPPITLKKHAIAFKKKHSGVKVKNGMLYVEKKFSFSAKIFLEAFAHEQKKRIREMNISQMKVI